MTTIRSRARGGVHTQTGSISITAAPETVWELITTVEAICEWYDTWDTVHYDTTDPRLRVGTSFRLVRHRRGRDETARCRVTGLTAPTRLHWEQSSPRLPTMSVAFLLIPGADTSTTELQHTRTWTTPEPSLTRLPRPHRIPTRLTRRTQHTHSDTTKRAHNE